MTSLDRGKRVLVTGASGFIGRHLVGELVRRGTEVSTISRREVPVPGCLHQYRGDLRDAAFLQEVVAECNPELIYHLAAYKERSSAFTDFQAAISTNLIGSLNLFTAAARLRALQNIIVVGTAEEYGTNPTPYVETARESPVSAYSFSKLCVTQLCEVLSHVYHLPFVLIRPTVAYGPGQQPDMFLPSLITALITDRPFAMTAGRQTRDFVYIDDLVEALMRSPRCEAGEILNIGSGVERTIAEVALLTESMLGKQGLVQIGQIDYRPGEIMQYSVDISKAFRLLEWTPAVPFDQGLKQTIQWFMRRPVHLL